ncbi:hypothetical protein LAV79_23825 [Peribacillus butanolivorans]|uniref:hypothetical protein n=1 Tax=Peribacillus butanolivorans TaxID=421767 RepID=UPI0030C8FD96
MVETKLVIEQLTDSPHLNGIMTKLEVDQKEGKELLQNQTRNYHYCKKTGPARKNNGVHSI